MKNTFVIVIVLLAFTQNSFAQDNYTIKRLIIFNVKNEVLLEKNKNGWMTPALRHNQRLSINDALYSLASQFGLKISKPKLSGIFSFVQTYKKKSSIRMHFTAKYLKGKVKIPKGKLEAKWFKKDKAIEMMSLPDTKAIFAMRDMTKQILEKPTTLWGGTFILKRENSNVTYEISEEFYALR